MSAAPSPPKSETSDEVGDEVSPQQIVELKRMFAIERQKTANLQLEVAELRQRAADITQVLLLAFHCV